MTLDELPAWACALLASERVARLGLLDDAGAPRVMPVTYAVWDGAVWIAVDDKPKRVAGEDLARVRWLRARPSSALTVDVYDNDWTRLAWVQLTGTTTVVDTAGHEPAVAALAARYAPYAARTPPGPLLRFEPGRALCWRAQTWWD